MATLPMIENVEIELTYYQCSQSFSSNFTGKLVGQFLKGTGEDDIGAFKISGVIDSKKNTIIFEKLYLGRHIVIYNGKLQSNDKRNASGKWSINNGAFSDKFKMRLPEFVQLQPTLINAEYHQRGRWYPFQFPAIVERTGEISGFGMDSVGEFAIDGILDVNNETIYWEKRYIDRHIVVYNGRIDPSNYKVTGSFRIPADNSGLFKMTIDKKLYQTLQESTKSGSDVQLSESVKENQAKQEIFAMLSDRNQLITGIIVVN